LVWKRDGYVHLHTRPHIQLKKLRISRTSQYRNSPSKWDMGSNSIYGDEFICHAYSLYM